MTMSKHFYTFFTAQHHIRKRLMRYVLSPVRLSVRYTDGSVKND